MKSMSDAIAISIARHVGETSDEGSECELRDRAIDAIDATVQLRLGLRGRQFEALYAHDAMGVSQAAIAKDWNVSHQYVQEVIRRARKRARKYLEAHGYGQ